MPFKFACPACGVGYKVKDELAGKKTKCQKCGERMTLTPPADETTGSGEPVYRHVASERGFEPAHGDANLIEAISGHMEAHVGEVTGVYHEILSDMIHLDIHMIAPAPGRPWNVLFTTGMSERPMTLPEGAERSDYSELVLCLPADWPLTDDDFKDEDNYWPVRWLKQLARIPHEYESWFGWGHTVPNGDPAEPFGGNTGCCCWMMVTPSIWFGDEIDTLTLPDGRTIEFLSPIPLYREEMDLKLSKGSEALIDRLEKKQIPMEQLFDPARPNVAKKRFGLF